MLYVQTDLSEVHFKKEDGSSCEHQNTCMHAKRVGAGSCAPCLIIVVALICRVSSCWHRKTVLRKVRRHKMHHVF